jgi:hypothetical protein
MKAKKAIKRLTKAEALLKGVLDQFSGSEEKVRGLIETARTSVVEAKTGIDQQAPKAAKKPPAREGASKSRLTAAGRKKISQAAKKRWAAAKRNGVHAATGKPLTKTA